MGSNVAPRVASELLDLVREPVGNTNLRPTILRLSEALVTLDYPAPAADLKAAAALQSDPMIVQTLNSCVRRLELLAKNGNDVAAWAAEMASTFPEVRRLAERRVAEIGSPAAVRALTARLARADLPEERAAVLGAIGEADGGERLRWSSAISRTLPSTPSTKEARDPPPRGRRAASAATGWPAPSGNRGAARRPGLGDARLPRARRQGRRDPGLKTLCASSGCGIRNPNFGTEARCSTRSSRPRRRTRALAIRRGAPLLFAME
jgi:hypothetical protein